MSDLYEDFANYIKTLLKSARPIVLLSSLRDFVPFWREFSDFIVVSVGKSFGRGARREAELIYGGEPLSVSVVPRSDYFIVYVKNQKNVDDLYLGVSVAHASASNNFMPVPVPIMSADFAIAVAKRSMNPALLEHLVITLPYVAAIPCNSVVREVKLLRDVLTIKYTGYMLSNDLAYNVIGLVLKRAVEDASLGSASYRRSFDSMLKLVAEVLGRFGVWCNVLQTTESFLGVDVGLYAVQFS